MFAEFVLSFPKGYIAHPYWPEMEMVINVQKESGVNRVRSQSRRDAALKQYLDAKGMTMADYQALIVLSKRPFYTLDGEGSEIIIPQGHVYGCLVQGADRASSGLRIVDRDNLRSTLECEPWSTGKFAQDGIFRRFAVVTSAQGKLSNQRALRENPYIEKFEATGRIRFNPETIQHTRLRDFLGYVGRDIGVGASRKLGWGRFGVKSFTTHDD